MNLLRRAPAAPARAPNKARPTQSSSPTSVGRALLERASGWLYDTRTELKKVVWPTREQAINLTGLVIAVALAVAAFVGVVDAVFEKIVQFVAGG
jgi:preprotein translocase subunit SecE